MPEILHITGGPRIRYTFDDVEHVIDLPLPDFNRHMAATYADRSLHSDRLNRTRRTVRTGNRRVFSFGYRYLADDLKQHLVQMTLVRRCFLTPRTLSASDPSFYADEEQEFECRVIGEIVFTQHLTSGWECRIELEEIGEPPEEDEFTPPPDVGAAGAASAGATQDSFPEPAPIGDASAVPEDCLDVRTGIAYFRQGYSGPIQIAPVPALAFPLDDSTGESITGIALEVVNIQESFGQPADEQTDLGVYIEDISPDFFEVALNTAPTALGGQKVKYTITQRSLVGDCEACWRRNTWHDIDLSTCAPVAPFPDVLILAHQICFHAGKVYVMYGGNHGGATKWGYLQIYDPVTNTWSDGPQIGLDGGIRDVRTNGVLIPIGTRLYYFGGQRASAYPKRVWSWAPGESVWTDEGELMNISDGGGGLEFCAAEIFEGVCYLVGGFGPGTTGTRLHDDAWTFNGSTFTKVDTFGTPRWKGSLGVLNEELYYFGGEEAISAEFQDALPVQNVWKWNGSAFILTGTPLPSNSYCTTAGAASVPGIGNPQTGGAVYAWIEYDAGFPAPSSRKLHRFDGATWYHYPAEFTSYHNPISTQVLCYDNVHKILWAMKLRRSTTNLQNRLSIYVPFEGSPVNPFTGEVAP